MALLKTLTVNGVTYKVATPVPEVNITLTASAWTGSDDRYSQVVSVPGVTAKSQVNLTPSMEQVDIFYEKNITFVTKNEGGVVTVYVIGQKPENNYTMPATIVEVVTDSTTIYGSLVTTPINPDKLTPGDIVRSVNGVVPDEYGNVTVSIPGGNGGGGEGGFSPIATVRQTDDGAIISITDVNGTTTATVANGKDGTSYTVSMVDRDYGYDMRVSSERGIVGYPIYHGKDGTTPHIGENGHWWIGNTDTGVPAESNSAGTSGTGLSQTEKTIILTLFRNIAYTSDMSNLVNELGALWGVVPDEPDEPDEPDVTAYTVTNNLTNVTNSNSDTTASGYYTATLSVADGYVMNVTITMGGVDITDDVFTADGTILIQNVTGDIVITAAAELAPIPVLYQLSNTPRTVNANLYEDTGLAFGSNTANGYTDNWTVCVDVTVTTFSKHAFCVATSDNARCIGFTTNGAGAGLIYILNNNSVTIPSNAEQKYKFVITHAANADKKATVHRIVDGVVVSTEVSASYGAFNNSVYAANLFVGGKTAAEFAGTFNEFTIYNTVLSEAHIAEFLGVA